MNRSQVAYNLSCALLFRQEQPIYFWTFTFDKLYPDWFLSRAWGDFITDLGNLYGGRLKGIKVAELHETHGIHYHALLNKRIWVEVVRRIGRRYGIGRVYVLRATPGAIAYLEQYIKPSGQSRMSPGIRRWSTVGGFDGVKCRDIDIDSPYHRVILEMQQLTGIKKVSWGAASNIMARLRRGDKESEILSTYQRKGKEYRIKTIDSPTCGKDYSNSCQN